MIKFSDYRFQNDFIESFAHGHGAGDQSELQLAAACMQAPPRQGMLFAFQSFQVFQSKFFLVNLQPKRNPKNIAISTLGSQWILHR